MPPRLSCHPLVLTAVLAASLGLARPARAEGVQWVLLIGVKEHDQEAYNTLTFPCRDVARLRQTLTERAGLRDANVLQLVTDAKEAALQPTRDNVLREARRFLAGVGKDDRVLIFFSGHGYLHEGVTYLVPRDFQKADPAKTGIPVAELRAALAACPAATKLVILDCCHAGGGKAAGPIGPSAESVAKSIVPVAREGRGCVVLASCRERESSFEWEERAQGIFTYWLCQGLEGAADKDGDGVITADEVYEYVYNRVPKTARQLGHPLQTPVREVGFGVVGVTPILQLRPNSPESACQRLADLIDVEVRNRGLKRVGVLEFLRPLAKIEGLAPEAFPAYCAEQVRARLQVLASKSYIVLESEVMKSAAAHLSVQALGDPKAMAALREKGADLDGVLTGVIKRRGLTLKLECELVGVKDGESLGKFSGVMPLNEDRLGDLGHSFDNRQREPGVQSAPTAVTQAEERTRQGHPLLNKKFPFKVEVWSVRPEKGETKITKDTQREKKRFLAADMTPKIGDEKDRQEVLIGARKDELFEIRVWNKSGKRVSMVLLLDGFNSLGQKRERLGQARAWLLDPTEDRDLPFVFDGWTFLDPKDDAKPATEVGAGLRHFKFTDLADSVAARERYGASVGLITLAFYGESDGRLAVGEGPEDRRKLELVAFKPGDLLGVVQIRYVDEEKLKQPGDK